LISRGYTFSGKVETTIDEDEYQVILYEPNFDLGLQMGKPIHVFFVFEDAVSFAQSLGISFLLFVPSEFDENLKKKDFEKRRFSDFEEEVILEEGLKDEAGRSYKVYVLYTREDFESEVFVEEETMEWDVGEMSRGFREEFMFWERKQRGLEEADAVFEYLEEPGGFADFWEEGDYVESQGFCIKKLKELVNKRKQEKKKLIYYVNLGGCVYHFKEYQKGLSTLRMPLIL